MAQIPLNKRDIDLQNLTTRVLAVATNFISLQTNYFEFKYGGDNNPSPETIDIYATLSGDLKGTVAFLVTGLVPNTNLTVSDNKLTLDPTKFAAYSVTITAELTYGGVKYTSNPLVISKRFTNLLTRLTRTYDAISAESDGSGYTLPTASNTLELYNGSTKITGNVTFGILGITATTITVDGLKLTISSTTGEITVQNATVEGWTSDSVLFTLVAKYGVDIYTATYSISKVRKGGATGDTTPAPTPNKTVTTSSSLTTVFIQLDSQPVYSQGSGHDFTLVYAVPYTTNYDTLVFENAALVAEFPGTYGSFNSDPNVKWKIWLKWRTIQGVSSINYQGPFTAETGADVTKLVQALAGPNKPFTILTTDTVIGGIIYKAGTYSTQSFIIDAQITTAKIRDLAVDDAKISNLSASKLTIGDGTVGGNLKSSNYSKSEAKGWFIGKDGSADFDAAVIRGTLNATQINSRGLSIYGADGTLVLDAGRSIQNQIYRYVPDATSGTALNMDPTCSVEIAWDKRNIVTLTDGVAGNRALAGRSGEHLVEGAPNDADDISIKAFKIPYDPLKKYQISAFVRKVGNVSSAAATHFGMLEFDKNNAPRYDWGGYLYGKILASDLTTEFKRYYVYIEPGALNAATAKTALHVILGYTGSAVDNYTGRIEIQDLRLDDITNSYNVFVATAASAATDATVKSTAAIATAAADATTKADKAKSDAVTTAATDAKSKADAALAAAKQWTQDNTLQTQTDNIIKTGFYLRTNGYNGSVVNGVNIPGTGFAIYDGGIVAKKSGKNTLAIGSDGNATFSGTLQIDSGDTSRLVIKNDKLEVWNNGVRRVLLGNLSS